VLASSLRRAIEKHAAPNLVVGWPLGTRGEPTSSCRRVQQFLAAALNKPVVVRGQPQSVMVTLVDERGTTVAARQLLGEKAESAGLGQWTAVGRLLESQRLPQRRLNRSQRLGSDSQAAALILQTWLGAVQGGRASKEHLQPQSWC
jgi:RNase H-fold protein (predicted Holliday junction resolvase)